MTVKIIVKGRAKGKVMKSITPINFLGTIDKKTGEVHDEKHNLYKRTVKDSILVFPYGVGSSVGAYTIFSLKSHNTAPSAMICQKADLTVASGCALANIPLVIVNQKEYDSLVDGNEITLDTESEKIL